MKLRVERDAGKVIKSTPARERTVMPIVVEDGSFPPKVSSIEVF